MLGRTRTTAGAGEFGMLVVFNQRQIVLFQQVQQRLLFFLRHRRAEGIAAGRHRKHRFDRPLLQRQFQGIQAHAFFGVGRDLQRLHAERLNRLQHAVIGRRLHRDDITRLGDRADSQQHRFLTAVGDHDVVGTAIDAGQQHQPGNLFAQLNIAGGAFVTEQAMRLPPQHLVDAAIERGHRQQIRRRLRRAQRHQRRIFQCLEHVHDHLAGRDFHRPAGRLGQARGRHRRRQPAADVVAGLWPRLDDALIFEQLISLYRRADTDALFAGQPAHRDQPVARHVQTGLDLGTDCFGDLLIQHSCALREQYSSLAQKLYRFNYQNTASVLLGQACLDWPAFP